MADEIPEPAGQSRFVPEHADQAYVVLPDGTKVLLGDYAKQEAKRKAAATPKVQIHIHRGAA